MDSKEIEMVKLGSAYVGALLAIGELSRFVKACQTMGGDRFGACHWCKRYLALGHATNCELRIVTKALKDLEDRQAKEKPGNVEATGLKVGV